jgi:hypothetical protein
MSLAPLSLAFSRAFRAIVPATEGRRLVPCALRLYVASQTRGYNKKGSVHI